MMRCRPTGAILVEYLRLTVLSGIVICSPAVAQVRRPFSMAWSDQSYGPDGPWQAVDVTIGSQDQHIALYPGGSWQSTILLQDVCTNTSISSICYATTAGTFDETSSVTWDNSSIDLAPDGTGWSPYSLGMATEVPINALARRATDTMGTLHFSVPLADLVGIEQAYQTYPGGQNYPLQVGILSLGASDINQTFSETHGPSVNGTFVTSWAYTSGRTESYSWGMHIGSAALDIPGSLYLGGFDANRVLGEVTTQEYDNGNFPIQLQDLTIGVVNGGSPWGYPNKQGLLGQGNSSISSGIQVYSSPADPYIYLPQSACDAIAADLPVIYQSDYGLYFWNTTDPQYQKAVTSPSYLGFTFDKNGANNENITIKVPFALLNLTLESPLVDQPTSYFPCMPTNGTYALGRAFLQAAFVGFNWNEGIGNWFLAQAPGPDYSQTTSISLIEPNDTSISGSTSSWEDTWSAHWTTLPSTPSSPNSTASSTPSGTVSSQSSGSGNGSLSTGAKVGIGVGCAIAGLLLIALGAWVFVIRQRRTQTPRPAQNQHEQREKTILHPVYATDPMSSGVRSDPVPSEIGSHPTDPSLHGTIFELPEHRTGLQELPDS